MRSCLRFKFPENFRKHAQKLWERTVIIRFKNVLAAKKFGKIAGLFCGGSRVYTQSEDLSKCCFELTCFYKMYQNGTSWNEEKKWAKNICWCSGTSKKWTLYSKSAILHPCVIVKKYCIFVAAGDKDLQHFEKTGFWILTLSKKRKHRKGRFILGNLLCPWIGICSRDGLIFFFLGGEGLM